MGSEVGKVEGQFKFGRMEITKLLEGNGSSVSNDEMDLVLKELLDAKSALKASLLMN